MKQYLDPTFWKTTTGFCVAILLIVALLTALGYYNTKVYGPENLLDMQQAQGVAPDEQPRSDDRPTNFVRE